MQRSRSIGPCARGQRRGHSAADNRVLRPFFREPRLLRRTHHARIRPQPELNAELRHFKAHRASDSPDDLLVKRAGQLCGRGEDRRALPPDNLARFLIRDIAQQAQPLRAARNLYGGNAVALDRRRRTKRAGDGCCLSAEAADQPLQIFRVHIGHEMEHAAPALAHVSKRMMRPVRAAAGKFPALSAAAAGQIAIRKADGVFVRLLDLGQILRELEADVFRPRAFLCGRQCKRLRRLHHGAARQTDGARQIIATPGCESNVKEIFDKTWELKQDPSMMIFNQFAEMGNPLWHYNVTGYALADLYEAVKKPGQRLAGACFTSGSAGTMSAGDLLKERYPGLKLAVGEALQCPTILDNGFGGHRIEGIGDKHIPWVHNVKNTDMVIDIDDEDSQRLLRLFNCKEGQDYLKSLGMTDEQIEKFTWMGISGIANVLCCIKMAKFYELTEDDVVVTVLTDSAVMYKSRVDELNEQYGAYTAQAAELDHNLHMLGLKTDNMLELTYPERKRVHNLKYYTWVEQQGMAVEDLNAQWYDTKNTWDAVHAQAKELDELINAFNDEVGLLKAL